MAGPSWLVDGNRIATKIRSASVTSDPRQISWKSNPSRACPNCQHIIDNTDVSQEWPGLPRGVKFDPSDQEIIWHLLTKVGVGNLQPHPFIDEFIPTVNEEDGICYTHPRKLPGVKQDGSVSHFFHRAIKAYNTGTRKRRKIHDGVGDVRWHKTGRTKPVLLEGVQKGCKKIMVLYVSPVRGGKAEKTNWVMHQYHLGTEEDEREGEYVISKVFYQQQQVKLSEKNEKEDSIEVVDAIANKVDPVTPKSVTPEPPRTERRFPSCDAEQESVGPAAQHKNVALMEEDMEAAFEPDDQNDLVVDNNCEDGAKSENHGDHVGDKDDNEAGEDSKWWDSESQYLLNSQQLVEALSLCDELLQSQSPKREASKDDEEQKRKPLLSDYAHLGPEDFKKDLEACQDLAFDPANIDLDTPPDFRLSQLEFASQESYIAWGASNGVDDAGEKRC